MWRVFLSAVVRKLAYVLVALAATALLGHRAFSQTCYAWSQGGFTGSASAVESQWVAAQGGGLDVYSSSCPEYPTFGGQSCGYLVGANWYPDGPIGSQTLTAAVVDCPNNCQNKPNMDLLTAVAQNSGAPVGGYCVAGCLYTNGNNALSIGATKALQDQAVSSSSPCTAGGTTPAPLATGQTGGNGVPTSTCVNNSGVSECVQSDGSPSNPSFSDYVAPNTIVPANIAVGSCVGYTDGAVACAGSQTVAITAPPGPDNGTPGQNATPTAVIAVSAGGGGGVVNYYSASTVAQSTGNALTTGKLGSGSNCTGGASCAASGTGSGNGSSPSDGSGDAASGGQTCASAPTCTGDPVYCAILNQEWLDRCYTVASSDVASAVGVQAGEGALLAGSTVDVSTAVSESGPISLTGTCPAPISITVLGSTYTLDIFGKVCTFAGQLGTLLLAIAYFSSALIFYKGVMA